MELWIKSEDLSSPQRDLNKKSYNYWISTMQTMPNRLVDIFIQQGTDYEQVFPVTDATSYTYYGCVRKHEDTDAFVEFNIDSMSQVDAIVVSLDASVTIDMAPKTYIYEILKKNPADSRVTLVANGNAIVDPGVVFKDNASTGNNVIVDGGSF